MITLYEVIPGPMGELGVYGQTALPSERTYDFWHSTQSAAVSEAQRICSAMIEDWLLKRLGNKVIVVAMDFASIEDVARRRPIKDSKRLVFEFGSPAASRSTNMGDWGPHPLGKAGPCRLCGQAVNLDGDGLMVEHVFGRGRICAGSGQEPDWSHGG